MREGRRKHGEFGIRDLSWACCESGNKTQPGQFQLWLWCRASLVPVEKGRKSNGLHFHPGIYSSRTPQAFCPKTGIKSAIFLLLSQRGGATLWKQTPSWEDPMFWGRWGHFLSQGHPVLPWSCSQAQGSWQALPNRARTDWTVQELFGKHCWSHVSLPSRRGLSLGRTSVATSTLLWKGTIWSSRKHGTLQLPLPACLWRVCLGLPGDMLAHQESLGMWGLVQWEWSVLDTPWAVPAGSLSAQRVISWSPALRATLNSQCRHLTPGVIQSHLFTSSSFFSWTRKHFTSLSTWVIPPSFPPPSYAKLHTTSEKEKLIYHNQAECGCIA